MAIQEKIASEAPETAWFRAREDEAAEQLAAFFSPGLSVAAETEKDLGLSKETERIDALLEEVFAPGPSLATETEKDLGLKDLDDRISRELQEIFSPAPSTAEAISRELKR